MFKEFFEGLSKDFDSQFARFKTPDEAIKYIEEIKKRIKIAIEDAKTIMELDATDMAISKSMELAFQRLIEQTAIAFNINYELNIPMYVSRLNQAILNPKTILITKAGEGKFNIKIDLNSTAGSLSDYGDAVKATRKQLEDSKGTKKQKYAKPVWASHAWYEKYFATAREGKGIPDREVKIKNRKTGEITTKIKSTPDTSRYIEKYWDTMNKRANNFKTLAPFWEILDQGTVKLSSDYGGTARPVNKKTNFVSKAEREIKKTTLAEYNKVKTQKNLAIKELPKLEEKLRRYEEIESILNLSEIYEEVKKRIYDPEVEVSILNVEKIAKRIIADFEHNEVRSRYYSQSRGVRASVRTSQLLNKLRRV